MPEIFTAPSHHDVLVLVLQIAVLLFTARALGELAQRLGQPQVIGELLAGIVLGPSLLSGLFPVVGEWILPQTEVQGYLLESVAMLGVMFLLVITGLETDLALIVRNARTALSVSWGGIVVCFASGFLLGWNLPDFLLVDPMQRLVFALFIATALSISAIPVIAKVLMDLDLMRRDIGQTILAAGMSDDTIGWILLGIVAGLARAGEVSVPEVAATVGAVLAFLVLSFTAGRWIVRRSLNFVQDEVVSGDRLLTLVIVFAFLWGAATQALELEPVLGAFVLGILFGQMRRLPEEVHHKLDSLALGIFAPIFFATAGLKVNIASLLTPTLIGVALLVILIATLGKVVGTYAGARLVGRKDHWTALSYGAGLNARGALEIIIATIGLQLGVLGQDMYSIIVLMAMATSIMAPFALRYALRRVKPERQELERLRREEIAEESLVANVHRVLLPVRFRKPGAGGRGALQTIEARILERLETDVGLSITLLTVVPAGRKEEAAAFLKSLGEVFSGEEVVRKVVVGNRPGDVILDEAKKDYDLVVLGAPERETGSDILFSRLVDFVVRVAPCPTMVVRGEMAEDEEWSPRRILVPTDGSVAARRAAELGFALAAADEEADVTILHVVVEEESSYHLDVGGMSLERQREVGHTLVEELRALGEAQEVRTGTEVRTGPDPETIILEVADAERKDLIVLGSAIRPGSERLFLGPRVERILNNAACPVLVLNAG